MAVAYDSSVESHTGTAGSVSQASYDFTLTVVGTLKGLLVYVFSQGANGNINNSVKIDPTGANIDVPAVTGGYAADTATEPATCKTFFLGSSIPTGNLALRVNRTNNADVSYAVAIGLTAGADTEVYLAGIQLVSANAALSPEKSVDDGSPGTNSLRFAGAAYGGVGTPTTGANSTALFGIVYSNDPNATSAWAVRETTAGQGARGVGWSAGTADDNASVYLAVREVAGGTAYTASMALGVTLSVAFAKQAKKPLAQSVTLTPSFARKAGKTLATGVTLGVAFAKKTSKTLAATATLGVGLAKSVRKQIAATVTLTPAMVVQKLKAVLIAVTATFTVAMMRSTNKVLAAGVTLGVAFAKQVSKFLAATITLTVGLAKAKFKVLTIAVSTTIGVAFSKKTAKSIATAITLTPAMSKQVGKRIAITVTNTIALAKSLAKTIAMAVTVTFTVSLKKSVSKIIAAGITFTVGLVTQFIAGVATVIGAAAMLIQKLMRARQDLSDTPMMATLENTQLMRASVVQTADHDATQEIEKLNRSEVENTHA